MVSWPKVVQKAMRKRHSSQRPEEHSLRNIHALRFLFLLLWHSFLFLLLHLFLLHGLLLFLRKHLQRTYDCVPRWKLSAHLNTRQKPHLCTQSQTPPKQTNKHTPTRLAGDLLSLKILVLQGAQPKRLGHAQVRENKLDVEDKALQRPLEERHLRGVLFGTQEN